MFGGYTLSSDVLTSTGQGSKTTKRSTDVTIQRQVLNSDNIVLMARTGNPGGTLKFNYIVRQEW
jgi:hypothetical protein